MSDSTVINTKNLLHKNNALSVQIYNPEKSAESHDAASVPSHSSIIQQVELESVFCKTDVFTFNKFPHLYLEAQDFLPVYNVSDTIAFPYLYPHGEKSPLDFHDFMMSRYLLKKQTLFAYKTAVTDRPGTNASTQKRPTSDPEVVSDHPAKVHTLDLFNDNKNRRIYCTPLRNLGLFDHDKGYRRPTLSDNLYAPGIFKGRSNEDAVEYVAYVAYTLRDRQTYKHLNEHDLLGLLPVLLCNSNFNDSLTEEQRATWQNFKQAFLARFYRSEAICWRDAQDLWKQSQAMGETCDD